MASTPEPGSLDVIAHRGASAEAPESTAVAFQRAVDHGADYVEADVQLTRDDQLVILHDPTLARTTDVASVFPDREPWNVSDLTLAELRRLDAGSWFDDRFAGAGVITLDELVDILGDRGGLDLELKSPHLHPDLARKSADVLRARGWLDGATAERLIVCSFDWDVLQAFGELAPGVRLLAVCSAPPDERQLASLAGWADAVAPSFRRLGDDDAARIRAAGVPLRPWLADSPVQMRKAQEWGADTIITNYEAVGRAVADGTDPLPAANGVVVTSVAAGPDAPGGEHVVLRNGGAEPVDVGGWRLRNQSGLPIPIPSGPGLPPGGELVLATGSGSDAGATPAGADRRLAGFDKSVLPPPGASLGLFTADHRLVDVYADVG